jgi:hypothetical protein
MTNATASMTTPSWRTAQTLSDPLRIDKIDVIRAAGSLLLATRLLPSDSFRCVRIALARQLQVTCSERCIAAGRGQL